MVRHHCDFSSEQLLHDPQSARKLLRHYPKMGYFTEQNNLRLSPLPPVKGGVSVTGIVYSDTTLLGGGGGGGGKLHFSLLKSAKRHKGTHFIVMIGLVLFRARDFSTNHKPRRCRKK